jgi:hypothetical protein
MASPGQWDFNFQILRLTVVLALMRYGVNRTGVVGKPRMLAVESKSKCKESVEEEARAESHQMTCPHPLTNPSDVQGEFHGDMSC